jgi:transposase-like protein
MLEREPGILVLVVASDVKRESLEPVMTQAIAPSSTVYTDSAQCNFLEEEGYHHERVNHSQGEYVRGPVHENGAEEIGSLLLPWLATFRGIRQGNWPAYATFFQFLFNHRHLTAFGHSQLVLQHLLAETWQWPVEAYIPHPLTQSVPGPRCRVPDTRDLIPSAYWTSRYPSS